jgi:hypothetical protein
MTQRAATSTPRAIGGLLAAAVTSGVFVASTLASAPAANATCASFWGIGNGNGCTSSFGGVAIAIGAGATATAEGFLLTSIAVGTHAQAATNGIFNLAVAAGTASGAVAGNSVGTNFANVAIGLGDSSSAVAASNPGDHGFGNIATTVGDHDLVMAYGTLNMASNLGNGNTVVAQGLVSYASNVGGSKNGVEASSSGVTSLGLNTAFAFFATDTQVLAFPGPVAIAGSIFQTGAHVTKKGPGFNINGITVGGAAAPTKAALGSSKKRTAASVPAVKHTGKK